ncbi:MAG TPA: Asp-tRNA(Asn)/Glu-tRNA(Gln) amidotransferase GatCAB subunit B, partial [Caulobacteraceae bacterium]
EIAAGLPELPDAKMARLESQYGLSRYDAQVLASDATRTDYFEAAAAGRDAKLVANTVTNAVLTHLARDNLEMEACPIPAEHLAELVRLQEEGVISSKIAREVFDHMWAGEGAPGAIVAARGLTQVSDTIALQQLVDALIAAHPEKAAAVREKPQAIGWFVGQVMRETAGKANPATVNAILKQQLGVSEA